MYDKPHKDPSYYVDAIQDTIHREVGNYRVARVGKSTAAKQRAMTPDYSLDTGEQIVGSIKEAIETLPPEPQEFPEWVKTHINHLYDYWDNY